MRTVTIMLLFFSLFSRANSQIISFIPKDRQIYILGGCITPPIKCLIDSFTYPLDTVKITAPYGGMYVYDSVSHWYEPISECKFVVKNSERNFIYELWGIGENCPWNNIMRFPFDTFFVHYPCVPHGWFYFVLKLNSNIITIDSMAVIFNVDISGDVNDKSSKLRFCLYQNYPNPFNSITSFKYHVASSGHIDLSVFDILGRKVAALVDEVKEPGEYEIRFNSDDYGLTSGIYFYQMRANDFISTRKFILMK